MERKHRVYSKNYTPELIKPYQILGKHTSQTNKERDDVCWKKGSTMTGLQWYQRIHISICREEPLYITAPQDHSGKNLNISTFSHKKIEKGHATCLHHIGFSRSEISIKSGGLVPGFFGRSKDSKAVYFSIVSSLDPCSAVQALHSQKKNIMIERV